MARRSRLFRRKIRQSPRLCCFHLHNVLRFGRAWPRCWKACIWTWKTYKVDELDVQGRNHLLHHCVCSALYVPPLIGLTCSPSAVANIPATTMMLLALNPILTSMLDLPLATVSTVSIIFLFGLLVAHFNHRWWHAGLYGVLANSATPSLKSCTAY